MLDNCVTTGSSGIECSAFRVWNYDLLVFAVLHEIGHAESRRVSSGQEASSPSSPGKKSVFANEYDAWHHAIDLWNETFGVNISVKQARYMMESLNSYIPDLIRSRGRKNGIAESESNFWCPMRGKRIVN